LRDDPRVGEVIFLADGVVWVEGVGKEVVRRRVGDTGALSPMCDPLTMPPIVPSRSRPSATACCACRSSLFAPFARRGNAACNVAMKANPGGSQ